MFCFTRPSPEAVCEFLAAQKHQQFSYGHVGASRTEAPSGYVVDHHRIQLGEGRIAFERARNAIKQWKMFEMTWLELFSPSLQSRKARRSPSRPLILGSGP